jgi:hypothetical protein
VDQTWDILNLYSRSATRPYDVCMAGFNFEQDGEWCSSWHTALLFCFYFYVL